MRLDEPASFQAIHDLAANFSDRQGLRVVPIALAIMVQALPVPAALPQSILGVNTSLIALVVGFGAYPLIGRLYARHFGNVEEMPYQGVALPLHIAALVATVLVAAIIDIRLRLPLFLSGAVLAAWLIATAWPSRPVRVQYLSMGALLALVSFAPLVGESVHNTARMYAFVFGFMLLMAGVRDHARLLSLMPSVEDETP